MRTLRALLRLGGVLVLTLQGLLTAALLFPWLAPAARAPHVALWCRRVLDVLGVERELRGALRPGPVLLVANHVSWLDILALNAVRPLRFVAKADVRHWPVLGWLVASAGTLFIERERKRDALRVVHQAAQALQQGDAVAVFPEGTTGDGHALLPFHANLLQAAIATHTPVQAAALRYRDAGAAVSAAAAYVGETSLVQSLWRVACAEGLCVQLQLLAPQATLQVERRALAEGLRGAIARALAGSTEAAEAGAPQALGAAVGAQGEW